MWIPFMRSFNSEIPGTNDTIYVVDSPLSWHLIVLVKSCQSFGEPVPLDNINEYHIFFKGAALTSLTESPFNITNNGC